MNKKVSIIIPTYNRPKLLKKAIDSVLLQTYQNFEIIIIDDCSKENIKVLIDNYRSKKIKYFRNETSLYAAGSRNKGIKKADGDFIAFLDDDDIWLPNKIEDQIKLFEKNKNLGLVYSGIKLNFDDNISYSTLPTKSGKIYKDMLIKNHIGGTISVMVKKEALQNNLFDTEFPAREEYDLWIRISKKWEVDYVNDVKAIAFYRNNIKRISTDLKNYEIAITKLNKKYKNEINNVLNNKEKKIREALQYHFLGSQAIKTNNKNLSLKYFMKSFKKNPTIKSLFILVTSLFGYKALIKARKIYGKLLG